MQNFSKKLSESKILVTRPSPQGEELCCLIQSHGGTAVFFPTIEIISLPLPKITLEKYNWYIFTSPQAVSAINHFPPHLKVAAVGTGTARVLKQAKKRIDVFPHDQHGSEALLALPEFHEITGTKILIIKGEGGRDFLRQELLKRGATVDTVDVYRRALPKTPVDPYINLIKTNQIQVIISTSNNSLENLKTLLTPVWEKLQKIPLIVISERMRIRAIELGFQHILLAPHATNEAILEKVERMYDN